MLDDMIDHLRDRRTEPVWRPLPDATRETLRAPLDRAPCPLATIYDQFREQILPYGTGNTHPRFMGWVHGGGTPVGMLAEMLAAGLNANLGGRDHAAVEVERQVIRWAARAASAFPRQPAASSSPAPRWPISSAVLVARTAALGRRRARRDGLSRRPAHRLRLGRRPWLRRAGDRHGRHRQRRAAPHPDEQRLRDGSIARSPRAIAADRATGR